jgi:outer membrane immunogenic protein
MALATGSIGATFDRALVYIKAGGAWVRQDDSVFLTVALPAAVTASSDNTRHGWTVGTGLEYALGGNWSARAEYDYISLDDVHAAYGLVSATLPVVPVGAILGHNDLTESHIHLVKLGLNYKLDWLAH